MLSEKDGVFVENALRDVLSPGTFLVVGSAVFESGREVPMLEGVSCLEELPVRFGNSEVFELENKAGFWALMGSESVLPAP